MTITVAPAPAMSSSLAQTPATVAPVAGHSYSRRRSVEMRFQSHRAAGLCRTLDHHVVQAECIQLNDAQAAHSIEDRAPIVTSEQDDPVIVAASRHRAMATPTLLSLILLALQESLTFHRKTVPRRSPCPKRPRRQPRAAKGGSARPRRGSVKAERSESAACLYRGVVVLGGRRRQQTWRAQRAPFITSERRERVSWGARLASLASDPPALSTHFFK